MRSVQVRGLDKPWSAITFGCWQIAPSGGWGDLCSPQEADRAVKAALEGGVTAFDTAEGYGDGESERRLGKALGSRLNEIIIISKLWPDAELTPEAYQKRLEDSLKALGRDYVDVYLVHWPSGDFATQANSEKLVELMVGLRNSGKARTIGLSNFRADDLERLGAGMFEFVVNQIPYNLLQREYEDETLALCRQAEMGYMAYSPTGRGLFGGRIDKASVNLPTRQAYFLYREPYFSAAQRAVAVMEEIARELNTVPINVSIAWVLAQANITTAVVGSRKEQQVREVCPAGDLVLSPEHLQHLEEARDEFELAVSGKG